MTVNNLLKDILNSVIRAQYKSYQYSKRLGEQDFRLLPIPYAEITEMTLDLKYAYASPSDEEMFYEDLDLIEIYDQLQPFLAKVLSKVLNRSIAYIDDFKRAVNRNNPADTTGDEWEEIKKNLQEGKLDEYILGDFKARFIQGLTRHIKKKKLSDYHRVAGAVLGKLLIQSIQSKLILHEDFAEQIGFSEKLSGPIYQEIGALIDKEFNANRALISEVFNSSVRIRDKDMAIIIDSEELDRMPESSIQRIKLTMNLKNSSPETTNQ